MRSRRKIQLKAVIDHVGYGADGLILGRDSTQRALQHLDEGETK